MKPDSPQRWLSLAGICSTLNLTPKQVRELVRRKYLVCLGRGDAVRYLDPTESYAEQLHLGRVLHAKQNDLPRDFECAAMFTLSEVAKIMGWSPKRASKWAYEKNLPYVRVGRRRFYTIETVRKLLWKKNDRAAVSKQQSPFLLSEMIEFFWRYHKSVSACVPTDADYSQDAELQSKVSHVLKMPEEQRDAALADLLAKASTAKSLICALRGDD